MNKNAPLIIENYPEDYTGYQFITLIQYNDEKYINIIDNVINNTIITYVLDFCAPVGLDEKLIIDIAYEWYYNNKHEYPISIHFSKLGIAEETSKILRCFPVDYVTRIIGPLPNYIMGGAYKIKKRKKKNIPPNMEVIEKRLASQH